jgi:hypothetical protein
MVALQVNPPLLFVRPAHRVVELFHITAYALESTNPLPVAFTREPTVPVANEKVKAGTIVNVVLAWLEP